MGVPVGQNPLGEWFNEVLDAVATWAPQVGKAVGNIIPGAAIVGNAIGMGAGAWRKTRKNNKGGNSSSSKNEKEKIKFDKKGKIKEIDRTTSKKPSRGNRRARRALKAANSVIKARNKGPKRRMPSKAEQRFKLMGPQ